MKYLFSFLVLAVFFSDARSQQLSLNGNWKVELDTPGKRTYTLHLPGTLDDAGIGTRLRLDTGLNIGTLGHLSRKVQYTGKAFYSRSFSIPAGWAGKKLVLKLGRVLWRSEVWIDGKKTGLVQESLSTLHEFDLTAFVVPGKKQRITIGIDNSNIYPGINVYATQYPSEESSALAHAYSNHTQIKWNGILGEITIAAVPYITPDDIIVTPDLKNKVLNIHYVFPGGMAKNTTLHAAVVNVRTGTKWPATMDRSLAGAVSITGMIPFREGAVLWDEFHPELYRLVTVIRSGGNADTIVSTFGIRSFAAKDGDLYLNDTRIFIRGNLECIIFPLTGYPPMKRSAWTELFKKAKAFGLNSFRFHSWCPPAAAFEAADETGFYLQVELPHWNLKVGADTAAFSFLQAEAYRILKAYGRHPSFLFFSMGNELEGDFGRLNNLVKDLRTRDPRHLYSTTTFTFQKDITGAPQREDDFYVTQWTKKGWIRGQVIFNDEAAGFSKDYNDAVDSIAVPVISHEIGQYAVFPHLEEIKKYTGNLVPANFTAVKKDMQAKGLLYLAPAYTQASGKFAALLYKEEIERALKTKKFDGFQLLQLQDYPGQGTALVGMLDAFWENKGFISAKEFHMYCSELTPLIRFPKAVYQNTEIFTAEAELANFYRPLQQARLSWQIKNEAGVIIQTGKFSPADYPVGNCLPAGTIRYGLDKITTAQKLSIELSVEGTAYRNRWNIWVYPFVLPADEPGVLVTSSLEEALAALKNDRKVLLCPQPDTLKGIPGKFVPVFWSPVHFPDQPGTMGLLIKKEHKALADFPTDFFSNWQWWDLTIKSKTLVAGDIPEKAIIVRVIDNFVRNKSLTNLFEVKVGQGKLLFCSMDILSGLQQRLPAKQLRHSLVSYMNSNAFQPQASLTAAQVAAFFK